MPKMEIDGRAFEVDDTGYLTDPSIWSDDVAGLIARHDGIPVLTEPHWAIVRCIRRHWEEKGTAPLVRSICQTTGIKLKELYELFPLGPSKGACRVAGLPKPDGCV